ncbi:MAG: primosomal protein N' [Deltaproteobacteria bacterium]|nr:primosomal protein N' [Deltaproteobacteria bacterium]
MMEDRWVDVALPLPLYQTFHYKIPTEIQHPISLGSRVWVPFQRRKLMGYVIDIPKEGYPQAKEIFSVVDPKPVLSDQALLFLKRVATYYASPLGEVLKAAFPFAPTSPAKKSTPKEIPHFSTPDRPKMLTTDQKKVLHQVKTSFSPFRFAPYLLQGVTGSGKTEVYLRLIDEVLTLKRQAMVLVPEISLTPQAVHIFKKAFPQRIAVYHSRLTPAERHETWKAIQEQEASVVIGTRSVVFAPFPALGLIVVDEEHDSSFKQEEKFRYHARDVALIRAKHENIPILLGSATPAIESLYQTIRKKSTLLRLPQRVEKRPLPEIEIVRLQKKDAHFENTLISQPLKDALRETLFEKQQTILLLNRRGYAAFLLCHCCGHVLKCKYCDVSLTVYLKTQNLICHYCAYTLSIPKQCMVCSQEELGLIGFGTEKIETYLNELFPHARIARLDKVSTAKKNALQKILSDFSNGNIDILIGTQMVAKGHDFPNVTLVGVILADIALNLPDFRAPERTFQLLTQVAGRAGRGEKKGRVIIQTFQPHHPHLNQVRAHNYFSFAEEELKWRHALHYPPFRRLINFKCQHPDMNIALQKLRSFTEKLEIWRKSDPLFSIIEILGPSPAPLFKLKNKYRFHTLIKAPSVSSQQALLTEALRCDHSFREMPRIQIDVDPLNLL